MALRWTGGAGEEVVALADLPARDGGALLDVSVQRRAGEAWIVAASDGAPPLRVWQWLDGEQRPTELELDGAPPWNAEARARMLHPVGLGARSVAWLVRTEPDDSLWMLGVGLQGTIAVSALDSGPMLGATVVSPDTAVGWVLPEGLSHPVLRTWTLPAGL